MPGTRANVKNEKQYEALKDKGMSKQRAAKIANSPDAVQEGREEIRFWGQRQARWDHRSAQVRRAQGGPRPRRRKRSWPDAQGSKPKLGLKPLNPPTTRRPRTISASSCPHRQPSWPRCDCAMAPWSLVMPRICSEPAASPTRQPKTRSVARNLKGLKRASRSFRFCAFEATSTTARCSPSRTATTGSVPASPSCRGQTRHSRRRFPRVHNPLAEQSNGTRRRSHCHLGVEELPWSLTMGQTRRTTTEMSWLRMIDSDH